MSDAIWKQGNKSGNWTAQHRGVGLVITVNPRTRRPRTIGFYLNGRLTESAKVTCSLDEAKLIAVQAADRQIEAEPSWALIANKDRCAPVATTTTGMIVGSTVMVG